MIILKWILIILVTLFAIICVIFIIAALAFLVMKWGSVGYYKGKEAFKRRIDVTNISDKNRKYKKF